MRGSTTLAIFMIMMSPKTVSAAAAPPPPPAAGAQLLVRQSNSNNKRCESSYWPCGLSNLPDDFCCPSEQICIPLNRGTSVICCPAGQNCQLIEPITCNVTLQNATAYPQHPVHNINLTATLVSCGGECCPQGYLCQNGKCAMDASVSGPTSSSSSSSSTKAATSLISSTTTISSPSSASPSLAMQSLFRSDPQSTAVPTSAATNPHDFPAKAIVAGFFPGLALGVLLALAIVFLVTRRRKTISAPIYQDTSSTCRTDFLRRTSSSAQASAPSRFSPFTRPGRPSRAVTPTTGTPLVRSMSVQSETASVDLMLADPSDPMSVPIAMAAHHQQQQQQQQSAPMMTTTTVPGSLIPGGGGQGYPSSSHYPSPFQPHQTDHLSPPTTTTRPTRFDPAAPSSSSTAQRRGLSQMTAFTDLMETAGFQKGEPFVLHRGQGDDGRTIMGGGGKGGFKSRK